MVVREYEQAHCRADHILWLRYHHCGYPLPQSLHGHTSTERRSKLRQEREST